jgi:hypothetical protein
MGVNVSKQESVSKTVNRVINQTVNKNSKSCTGSTQTSLLLSLTDLNAGRDINIRGIKQSNTVSVDFSCLQETHNKIENDTTLKNKIKEEIEQEATGGLGINISENKSYTSALNEVINQTTNENVSDCVSNTLVDQELIMDNLKAARDINISDISQSAVVTTVASCIQKDENATKAISNLQTEIDKKMKQTTGSGASGGSSASLGSWWMFLVACFCCVLLSSLGGAGFMMMQQ